MQKRSSIGRGARNGSIVSVVSSPTVDESILRPVEQKNPAAVALGRLGGLKGGRARAEKLSAKRRQQIARKAAQARWESSSE